MKHTIYAVITALFVVASCNNTTAPELPPTETLLELPEKPPSVSAKSTPDQAAPPLEQPPKGYRSNAEIMRDAQNGIASTEPVFGTEPFYADPSHDGETLYQKLKREDQEKNLAMNMIKEEENKFMELIYDIRYCTRLKEDNFDCLVSYEGIKEGLCKLESLDKPFKMKHLPPEEEDFSKVFIINHHEGFCKRVGTIGLICSVEKDFVNYFICPDLDKFYQRQQEMLKKANEVYENELKN